MEMKLDAAPSPNVTKLRSVSILGSTGSVGRNTLDLIARAPDQYRIDVLTGNDNVDLLIKQALAFRPKLAVIGAENKFALLKEALVGSGVDVAAGAKAIEEAASVPTDFVMASIVGIAGLAPTLAAARRGAVVGLANKECLVCAGDFLLDEIEVGGGELIPVDSEHNAIFQVFDFLNDKSVEKLILTASGGPFRETDPAALKSVTPQQAVAHPNWTMGAKISVDSATMMNKGLELIEAYYLFPVREEQIDILVHPQSVVHSMVAYVDGSVLAQLGTQDMRIPISYALGWPSRIPTPSRRLDLHQIGQLTFEAPDTEKFPALRIAREALKAGGAAPIVLNAANEVAVARFLAGGLGFLDIAMVVERTLERSNAGKPDDIEAVAEIDLSARRLADEIIDAI